MKTARLSVWHILGLGVWVYSIASPIPQAYAGKEDEPSAISDTSHAAEKSVTEKVPTVEDPFAGIDESLIDQLAQINGEMGGTLLLKQDLGSLNLDQVSNNCAATNDKVQTFLKPVCGAISIAAAHFGADALGEIVNTGIQEVSELLVEKHTHGRRNKKILDTFKTAMGEYKQILSALVDTETQARGFLHMMELIYTMKELKDSHGVPLYKDGRLALIDRLGTMIEYQQRLIDAFNAKVETAFKELDKTPSDRALLKNIGKLKKVIGPLKRMTKDSQDLVDLLRSSNDQKVCHGLKDAMHQIYVLEAAYQSARVTLLNPKAINLWKEARTSDYMKSYDQIKESREENIKAEAVKSFQSDRDLVEYGYQKTLESDSHLMDDIQGAMNQCLKDKSWIRIKVLRRKSLVGKKLWNSCWQRVTRPSVDPATEKDYTAGYSKKLKKYNDKRVARLAEIDTWEKEFQLESVTPDDDIFLNMIASYRRTLEDINQKQMGSSIEVRKRLLKQMDADIDRVCDGIQLGI